MSTYESMNAWIEELIQKAEKREKHEAIETEARFINRQQRASERATVKAERDKLYDTPTARLVRAVRKAKKEGMELTLKLPENTQYEIENLQLVQLALKADKIKFRECNKARGIRKLHDRLGY